MLEQTVSNVLVCVEPLLLKESARELLRNDSNKHEYYSNLFLLQEKIKNFKSSDTDEPVRDVRLWLELGLTILKYKNLGVKSYLK